MNIAVCEDNVIDCEAICSFLKDYCIKNCYDIKIHTFDSGEAFLSALSHESFNAVFLDIFLTGMSGVETAQKIREQGRGCTIVFITTSADYALDGYDVSAVSYVVKPIDAKKMEKALAMCQREFAQNSRYIEVISDYQNTRISLRKIRYVEVYGKASFFHLDTIKIKTYLSLDKIEEMLGGTPFLRCHRCFLVNMNYVAEIREREFLMNDGNPVSIRKNGRAEVKLAMARFMCS